MTTEPNRSMVKNLLFDSTGSSDSGVFAELREPKEVYRFTDLFEKSSLNKLICPKVREGIGSKT